MSKNEFADHDVGVSESERAQPKKYSYVEILVDNILRGIRGLIAQDMPRAAQQMVLQQAREADFLIDGNAHQIIALKHYIGYLLRSVSALNDASLSEFEADIGRLSHELDTLEITGGEDAVVAFLHVLSTRACDIRASLSHLTALVAAHLYGSCRSLPTSVEGWYTRTLDNLGQAHVDAYAYVDQIRNNAACSDERVQSFLDALRYDITSFHGACLHLATIFAIHAQEQNCAVYTGTSPHSFEGRSAAMKQRMQSLLSLPVYKQYNAPLQESGGVRGSVVHIPTYISAVDIEEFVKRWKELWKQAAISLDPQSYGASTIQHFFRDTPSSKGQARIQWSLPVGRQETFNVRIDHEHDRNRLTLDIGHVTADAALSYAEEVGKQSEKGEVVMGYSAILDSSGSHSHIADQQNPLPRGKEIYYPSVMKSVNVSGMNERMALIASAILDQAQGIGLFGGDTFGYHCRHGRIDEGKHQANFPSIVRAFRNCVVGGRRGT